MVTYDVENNRGFGIRPFGEKTTPSVLLNPQTINGVYIDQLLALIIFIA